jgi:hypothetical protein
MNGAAVGMLSPSLMELKAPQAGTVKHIAITEGAVVQSGSQGGARKIWGQKIWGQTPENMGSDSI